MLPTASNAVSRAWPPRPGIGCGSNKRLHADSSFPQDFVHTVGQVPSICLHPHLSTSLRLRGEIETCPRVKGQIHIPTLLLAHWGDRGQRSFKGTVGPSPILAWPLSQDFSIHWIRCCRPASEKWSRWSGRNLQALLQDTDKRRLIPTASLNICLHLQSHSHLPSVRERLRP